MRLWRWPRWVERNARLAFSPSCPGRRLDGEAVAMQWMRRVNGVWTPTDVRRGAGSEGDP